MVDQAALQLPKPACGSNHAAGDAADQPVINQPGIHMFMQPPAAVQGRLDEYALIQRIKAITGNQYAITKIKQPLKPRLQVVMGQQFAALVLDLRGNRG